MFGGARYDHLEVGHVPIDKFIWLFDLDRYQWTQLTNVSLPRAIYFQAAAANNVSYFDISNFHKIKEVNYSAYSLREEKYTVMEV